MTLSNWHTFSIEEVLKTLHTQKSGLTKESVDQRLSTYGKNELKEKEKSPIWWMFLKQFTDFMILILISAAIISGIVGDWIDTLIIIGIVIINAVIGFVQEYNAEKAMEALKKMASVYSIVIRDGIYQKINAADLVPGDIVVLEAGNTVPADIRLIEVHALKIDESVLTGESIPVDKHTSIIEKTDIPIGDQYNMAFKGTYVTYGRAIGVVVKTGMQTEIGRIADLLQTEETLTPLQKRMNDFSKKLSYIIILICVVLFITGLIRGESTLNMLLLSISLAVAAIPEALPALITIALARGAKQMVKQNALIRKLPAVETLGSVTFICSDKTGTLTENKMKVVKNYMHKIHYDENNPEKFYQLVLALNHDVILDKDKKWIGDPTEVAIVEWLTHNGVNTTEIQKQYPRVGEIPFDSDRKCMTTIHTFNAQYIVIIKGAMESVLNRLKVNEDIDAIQKLSHQWAVEGLRVLAYGYKLLNNIPPVLTSEIENDFSFIGCIGLIDPPRKEVKQSITECKEAGIKPVMITGDHPATAAAIAKEIGIMQTKDILLTGHELEKLSIHELQENVEKISVYARVSPEQKLKIVKALQYKKHFVAMTGDGVNDAPSLKAADIGIAMGINGTDVSKEASDMILLDDNFATIVKAVKEGRRIYDNIRKFIKYILTCNSAEIWTLFLAPIVGLPMPLLPIHILWINLVTDGLPALALAEEKAEPDIMKRPPRQTTESLFARGNGYHIIWAGLLMAILTLGTQIYAFQQKLPHWQTMVFSVLSFLQIAHVMAIKSDKIFLFRQPLNSNTTLWITIIFTVILQLIVIYHPIANRLFKTEPLTGYELLICIVIAIFFFHVIEIEKYIKYKFFNRIV